MLDLGTLKLGVKVDTESAKSQLGQVSSEVEKTGTKADSLASKAKTMIKAFAAAYAVKEIIAIGKAALEAYASFEQLEGGVNKIFGSDAQTVIKNAEKAYKTAGISANTYMEQVTSFSSSLLQSLGGDTKKAAEVADMAVQDMADNANTFGTSMEAIQNAYQGFAKQNYVLLDNLKLGYGGTKTEMERLLKDAEKLSGIKYDISNLNDVYQAIHIIQGELNITGTTAKEAASTMEGSINSMKAAWENMLTAFGGGEGIPEAVSAFVETLGNVVRNAIPIIVNIAKGLIDAILLAVPQFFNGGLGNTVMKLIEGIASYIPTFIQNFATMLTEVANSLSDPTNANKFLEQGAKIVVQLVKGIIESLPSVIEAGVKLLLSLLQGIVNTVPTLFNYVGALISNYIQMFRDIDLFQIGKDIISSLLNGLKNMWSSITSWVSEKVDWIKSMFSSAKNSANTKGHRIGIETVPYDNYQASLHKGEMILTAAEANQYQKYLNGVTDAIGNINTSSALENVTIEVVSVLDGKIVAKATAPLIDKLLGNSQSLSLRGV